MQGLRKFSILFFILALSVFITYTVYTTVNTDKDGPKISIKNDLLKISVKDSEKSLLNGIQATDAKDGDVTNTLIVESISNFTNKGKRIVSYAAFDRDWNISKATREIEYTDYTAPQFVMKDPPRFSVKELSNTTDYSKLIQAKDCLDGDISKMIYITSLGEYEESHYGGKMDMEFQVSNSAGDVATIPITVAFNEVGAPLVNLTSYVVYLKKGEDFNPNEYIKDVQVGEKQYTTTEFHDAFEDESLTVKNGVNPNEEGFYQVTYTVTVSQNGRTPGSIAYLEVVVY